MELTIANINLVSVNTFGENSPEGMYVKIGDDIFTPQNKEIGFIRFENSMRVNGYNAGYKYPEHFPLIRYELDITVFSDISIGENFRAYSLAAWREIRKISETTGEFFMPSGLRMLREFSPNDFVKEI